MANPVNPAPPPPQAPIPPREEELQDQQAPGIPSMWQIIAGLAIPIFATLATTVAVGIGFKASWTLLTTAKTFTAMLNAGIVFGFASVGLFACAAVLIAGGTFIALSLWDLSDYQQQMQNQRNAQNP